MANLHDLKPYISSLTCIAILGIAPLFGEQQSYNVVVQLQAAQQSFAKGHYKDAIVQYENVLRHLESPLEKANMHLTLAGCYYRDQAIDKAFLNFLKALDYSPCPEADYDFSEKERILVEQAQEVYFSQTFSNSNEIALQIIADYSSALEDNPNFYTLSYLIAASHANLGNYEKFFEMFYKAYNQTQDYFLAPKAKGVIYTKLQERARASADRKQYHELAKANLKMALDKNPKDPALYRMLVSLTPDAERKEALHCYLQQMMNQQVAIPRADIYFYVYQSAVNGEFGLAQKVIDSARQSYQYSRSIDAAQDFLNQVIAEESSSEIDDTDTAAHTIDLN
ncbi:MAG: hypothetical protein K0S74_367 [Chlamydiales bacterium]|jgi:tetratricopeptide (TPR) repeat protein|nr:hypothetical protein [Chlamydiales bacterium]